MTDEQIKQNAEEYANTRKYTLDELYNSILTVEEIVKLAYIAGAHSRDKEISYLEGQLSKAATTFRAAMVELNSLRSQWISVEESLPDAHTPVYAKNNNSKWFFALRTGNRVRPWYNIVERRATEVTHWGPIPEP